MTIDNFVVSLIGDKIHFYKIGESKICISTGDEAELMIKMYEIIRLSRIYARTLIEKTQ